MRLIQKSNADFNRLATKILKATGQVLSPVIYGGTGVDNNLIIESTSNPTKTSSYLILQPTYGGNVGVGTTVPTVKLHVTTQDAGNITDVLSLDDVGNQGADRGAALTFNLPTTASSAVGGRIAGAREGAATPSYLAFSTHNGTSVGERVRITSGGRLIIGATVSNTPSELLHVVGNLKLVGTSTMVRFFLNDAAAANEAARITAIRTDVPVSGDGDIQFIVRVNQTQTEVARFASRNLGMGIGVTVPTGLIHVKAGTSTAGTAPLKFTSGTNLATGETGAVEYNGTNLFFTRTGTTRENLVCASAVNSVSPTSPNRTVTVNIDGTTYYLAAKTTND